MLLKINFYKCICFYLENYGHIMCTPSYPIIMILNLSSEIIVRIIICIKKYVVMNIESNIA